MKSSDNTLLFVGLFVLIVVIVALIVYYTRPGETKTPDQTSDDTVLKVENLTFERTLNPDPSVGDGVSGYTIEPYGVEYATGKADYNELSKNVTFTMKWTNAPGFNKAKVEGFKIEHFVKKPADAAEPTLAKQTLIKKPVGNTTADEDEISKIDFGACRANIVSNGGYSVVGQNSFKLYALTRADDTTSIDWNSFPSSTHKYTLLYNGIGEKDPSTNQPPTALQIEKEQLSVTLDMTTPETTKFVPKAPEDTSSRTVISKSTYTVSNDNNSSYLAGVYLTTVPGTGGKQFYFTFDDGKFLMIAKSDGNLNKRLAETETDEKFIFEIVDRDNNKGKIRQAASRFLNADGTPLKTTDTARTVAQGPVTIPAATAEKDRKYLSTAESSGTLKLYTQKDSGLTKKIFERFTWTFTERIAAALPIGKGTTRVNNDKTGNSVCISGGYAFVGEPGFSNSKGRVHIYKRDKFGKWGRTQTIPSNEDAGSLFGTSVYAEGDTLAIGAPGFNSSRGRVHIYTRNSEGTFVLKARKTVGGAKTNDEARFGTAISIYRDFILVGAPGNGLITLFKKGPTWAEATSSTTKMSSGFGESLDIYENRFIVGAPGFNVHGTVFIYTFNTNTGVINTKTDDIKFIMLPSNLKDNLQQAIPGVKFGTSIAFKGDTIFVGAPNYIGLQSGVTEGGRVYIFKSGDTAGGSWDEWQRMPIQGGNVNGAAPGVKGGYTSEQIVNSEEGAKFGSSLNISGDKLIIGSSGSNKVYIYTGVFSTIQNSSVKTTRYLSSNHPDNNKVPVKVIQQPSEQSDAKFGAAVSIDGDYAIIGEPNRKNNQVNTGDSYIIPVV